MATCSLQHELHHVDHPMTTKLKASVQSLVFVIMLAATLFATAGRIEIVEFWVYIAIVAAVSALALAILGADLMQERMRPEVAETPSKIVTLTRMKSAKRLNLTAI
jgi:hypothetical protein